MSTSGNNVAPSDVLTSWKGIAAYLGMGVRAVQRWERELGMPIRRPSRSDSHVVIAWPEELDEWRRERIYAKTRVPSPADFHLQVVRLRKLMHAMRDELNRLIEDVNELESVAKKIARRRKVL